MFVSIHIPKTAGTMLGYVFDFGSGRRLFWDYDSEYANARKPEQLILANLGFIECWFWGIHGHFFYEKYAEALPSARYIAAVRHPVDRAVSQYRHEVYDAVRGRKTWRSDAIRSGRMDLVDFVLSDENVRCAQAIHLAGREIDRYDFLFAQDLLAPGLTAFGAAFAFRRADPYVGRLPDVNRGEERVFADELERGRYEMLTRVTDAQRAKAFDRMPEEVDLYRRAVGYAERLVRRWS
ncbi:hypothetical protein STAQ_48690 [Allostella sp. ATCC 35155]|nr:hypothetical protein STAQ_48690 [Stella sp. ATCC 35155]